MKIIEMFAVILSVYILAMFEANAIQFCLEQMFKASSDQESSSYMVLLVYSD